MTPAKGLPAVARVRLRDVTLEDADLLDVWNADPASAEALHARSRSAIRPSGRCNSAPIERLCHPKVLRGIEAAPVSATATTAAASMSLSPSYPRTRTRPPSAGASTLATSPPPNSR